MDYWQREFATTADNELTAPQDSLIVSILSAGTFFGALAAAPFGDLLGRRMGLMVSAGIVFNLGVILQTAATAIPMFVAGRFFAGLGVGLVSALVPLYQSETSPKWIRGTIVGAYQLAITIVSIQEHKRTSRDWEANVCRVCSWQQLSIIQQGTATTVVPIVSR